MSTVATPHNHASEIISRTETDIPVGVLYQANDDADGESIARSRDAGIGSNRCEWKCREDTSEYKHRCGREEKTGCTCCCLTDGGDQGCFHKRDVERETYGKRSDW